MSTRPSASGASAPPEGPPRSLADQLRRWSDEQLTALLRDRPDLATPAPHDTVQLASRAATRSSLVRALDLLTELELQVLDAVVVAGRATREALVALVHAEADAVLGAVERLAGLALVWEGAGGLRTPSGVADALRPGGTGPSGLHPFAAPADDGDAAAPVARAVEAVGAATAPVRALLEHVDAHGGTGASGSARRTVALADAASPVEEAIARRMLLPREDDLLVLPGDVGTAVRGGRTTREPVGPAPAVATSARDAALVDRAAAGAAFEAVRRVELLLDQWGTAPPKALRAGGLAVRDLKATATTLHVEEPAAALLVEVAHAAGLLAPAADTAGDVAWVPTDRFDVWSTRSTAERWVALATAWLSTTRTPALVGTKDQGGKTRNALAPELASTLVAEVRRSALGLLADLPPGEVLATGTGLPSLVARARWLRPRRPRVRDEMLAWAVEEGQLLGLVALGGLASYARPLLAAAHGPAPEEEQEAAGLVAPLLPRPVDHVLLQADLTAVAPGPLETALARRLQLVADVESRGGATVYRFHAGSVRRAFDAGWSATEVHAFLDEVSRTPVPQPLTYLVDDAARTFGTVRVGYAESFLRADDEAALTELLHHPKAAGLGLRRIAPTVLISEVPVDVLLPRLRELGAAPVVEAPDGTVRVARPDLLRARTPKDRRAPGVAAAREVAHLAAVVTAVRAGDRAAVARPAGEASGRTPAGAVAALREAAEAGRTVLISYVDNHGSAGERLVRPLRVEGGVLTAHDERADDERGFAVHRITAVRPVVG